MVKENLSGKNIIRGDILFLIDSGDTMNRWREDDKIHFKSEIISYSKLMIATKESEPMVRCQKHQ